MTLHLTGNKNNKPKHAMAKHTYITGIALLISVVLFLQSCVSTEKVVQLKSSNSSYRVKSLVMHFTAVNYEQSLNLLVNEGGGVSSHYLIPQLNDASYPKTHIEVLQLVDESERAWHAGVSYWQGRTGLNDSSIGIEIVNMPKCIEREVPLGFIKPKAMCTYPEFEHKQIEKLIVLTKQILKRNPDISPTAVVGHSDIAPSRKNDPGPRFPWQKLYEAGIGAWYDLETLEKYWPMFDDQSPSIGLIQKALNTYGYGIAQTGILDRQTQDVLGAFQMHFLPWQVNYQADSKTSATLFALLDKYFPQQLNNLMEQYQNENKSIDDTLVAKSQNNIVFSSTDTSQIPLYNQHRATFLAYKNTGTMHVNGSNVAAADIYINDQKLSLGNTFANMNDKGKVAQSLSVAKRTQDGINTVRVENLSAIDPAVSPTLSLGFSYPEIVNLNTNKKVDTRYNFSALDTFIQNDVDKGFPGASIIVLHKGRIIKQSAYGYARKYADGGEPLVVPDKMQTNTLFDLASNTKVFATTLAIMQLVDQGKLTLSAPITQYLSDYTNNGRDTRTIADLLSHSSGYSSEIRFFTSDNPFGESLFSQSKTLTGEYLMTQVPFANARRSAQQYSDTNFMVLGLLVERITKMPLDTYLEQNIYQILGLTNTKFVPLSKGHELAEFAATEIRGNSRGGRLEFENIRTHVLQGEVHDEKAFYSMQGVAGHAGLFSNTHDLAVLAQLLLNGGGYGNQYVFSPYTLRRFVHPEFIKDAYGLGWQLASEDNTWHFGAYASANAFGHTGWTGTATVIDPDLDLAVIYLTNKKHSPVVSSNQGLRFKGDDFDSAKYGNIMTLVYEAVLAANAKHNSLSNNKQE